MLVLSVRLEWDLINKCFPGIICCFSAAEKGFTPLDSYNYPHNEFDCIEHRQQTAVLKTRPKAKVGT